MRPRFTPVQLAGILEMHGTNPWDAMKYGGLKQPDSVIDHLKRGQCLLPRECVFGAGRISLELLHPSDMTPSEMVEHLQEGLQATNYAPFLSRARVIFQRRGKPADMRTFEPLGSRRVRYPVTIEKPYSPAEDGAAYLSNVRPNAALKPPADRWGNKGIRVNTDSSTSLMAEGHAVSFKEERFPYPKGVHQTAIQIDFPSGSLGFLEQDMLHSITRGGDVQPNRKITNLPAPRGGRIPLPGSWKKVKV